MPEIERNLPYWGQVRCNTPGNRGSIRINRVSVVMVHDGRRDKKYQQCVKAIKMVKSQKELKEEHPDHPFLKLTAEFVSKKRGIQSGCGNISA